MAKKEQDQPLGIGGAVREVRKLRHVTLEDLAQAVDYDAGNLSRFERAGQKIDEGRLRQIARFLKVPLPALWRLADYTVSKIEKLRTERDLRSAIDREVNWGNAEPLEIRDAPRSVPLISWVQAGQWNEVVDPYAVGDGEKIPVYDPVSDATFALRVRGDSMLNPVGQPTFPAGSVIIVDPVRRPENGQLVIAKMTDADEATFKRLVIDGARTYLEPLNPRYPVIEVTKGELHIVGVVIAKAYEPLV